LRLKFCKKNIVTFGELFLKPVDAVFGSCRKRSTLLFILVKTRPPCSAVPVR